MDLTVIRPEFNINWVDFVLVEEYLGIYQVKENPTIIYPNPAKDKVFIKSSNPIGDVSVYNISGQIVKSIKNIEANDVEINISSLKRGIHFFNVSTSNINYKVLVN
jgi:thiamine biosynthesis protein ThiC